MVQRVLFSKTAIRISRPGIEVASAGIRDLLLDVGYRSQQILEHGIIPLVVSNGGSAGFGPWEGTKSIGPYSQIPDVTIAFVYATGKQLNPPRIEANGAGSGQTPYFLNQLLVSTTQISAKASVSIGVGGSAPPNLTGLTYIAFRRGQV